MKTVLIWPPATDVKTNFAGMGSFPLGILYLAAYLREKGITVKLIDAIGLAPDNVRPFKEKYVTIGLAPEEIAARVEKDDDLIGISATASVSHNVVLDIIKNIRKAYPDKKIVVGGNHASFEYESFLAGGADFVVIGEGEVTLFDLTQHLDGKKDIRTIDGIAWKEDGKVLMNPRTKFIENIDELPFPARDLLSMENYWKRKDAHGPVKGRYTPIFSSRGCPFNCAYCSSPKFWQRRWRPRSPKNVVDEIEYCIKTFGITDFHFEDDNLTLRKDRIVDICKEILNRGLNITWNTPNGIKGDTIDLDTLSWMRKAGCQHITIAPETGSQRLLEIMCKSVDLEHQVEIVRYATKLGMSTCAFFILGFKGETAEDREKTKKYMARLAAAGLDEAGIFIFTPLPGTDVFKEFESEFKDEWEKSMVTAPDWRKDYGELQKFRKGLYLTFFISQALHHPEKVVRYAENAILNRQNTKTDRTIRRTLSQFRANVMRSL